MVTEGKNNNDKWSGIILTTTEIKMSAMTISKFLTRLQQTSFRSQSNLNSITNFGTLPTCFEIERPKSEW